MSLILTGCITTCKLYSAYKVIQANTPKTTRQDKSRKADD